MKTLSSFFDRISNWKVLLGTIAVYLSFPAYFFKNAETKMNALSGQSLGPIDLTMGFTPERTLQMVASYGHEARAYYATVEYTVDVAYPVVYSFLFAIILSLLFRHKSYKPFDYVNLFPLVVLVLDYLENITIVSLLNSYPTQSMTIATLCELFKLMKWISLGATLLLIIYGLLKQLPKSKTQ
ncbi:MAG: hypothetical protein R2822_05415 [Spirosomataceae bacterium]